MGGFASNNSNYSPAVQLGRSWTDQLCHAISSIIF